MSSGAMRVSQAFADSREQKRVDAIKDFVDWLYERGPNPDETTREKLVAAYEADFDRRVNTALLKGFA
jgi:hypothetical protein